MIGLHDHHRAHSTRVARTVEKTFASFSHQRYPPPSVYTTSITDSGHAGAGDRETDRAPACFKSGSPPCHHSSLPVPRTYTSQDPAQADTGIMTDAESLRDTWSMTLNVNCPHCGQMHAVSVRETYIDAAIRNVSEIARRV
jgi:hypothetical protein